MPPWFPHRKSSRQPSRTGRRGGSLAALTAVVAGHDRPGRVTPHAQPPDGVRPPLRAVIIDLDNLQGARTGQLPAFLASLLACCGPYDVALASGRDWSFRRYRSACQELGIRVFEAPGIRDGADHALLESAAALAQVGVAEFYVLSADHAFANLPGRLHVVVPDGQKLSERLSRRAASITRVPTLEPASPGASPIAAPAATPAASCAAVAPSDPTSEPMSGRAVGGSPASRAARNRRRRQHSRARARAGTQTPLLTGPAGAVPAAA